MSDLEVRVADDPAAAAALAAEELAACIATAVGERRRAVVAVSGGATPGAMLEDLAAMPVSWRHVHVTQVDERVAPEGDPDRNLTGLREALLDRVAIPAGNVVPMPVDAPELDAAAVAFAAGLIDLTGGALDAVHLGLGDDGHTASLTPGDAALGVTDRWAVVIGPYRGHRRMTLTLPALAAARRIVWLVVGAGKAEMLARLVAGDEAIPAGRVARGRAVMVCDRAAAARL